jgi:hypothetical protein
MKNMMALHTKTNSKPIPFLSIFGIVLAIMFTVTSIISAQSLNVPERPTDALSGTQFKDLVTNYTIVNRENAIFDQITSGNIPDFLRTLVPVTFSMTLNSTSYEITYHVIPDYLAVGSNDDYFLMPMTPLLAQRLAYALGLTLPTRKMVNQIWSAAPLKLAPATIPPSDQMTTIPVMWDHNIMVRTQRNQHLESHPLGTLVAGTKKDVIISNAIYGNAPPRRVVIYGWHYQNGTPIQPRYAGHAETYADYSHGIRMVQNSITINGDPGNITDILQNNALSVLFSDEGTIETPFYPLADANFDPPTEWGVVSEDSTSLGLYIKSDPGVTHYQVYLSSDGNQFQSAITLPSGQLTINSLQKDSLYFIKVKAIRDGVPSRFSEVLGGVPSRTPPRSIIVNGFDRPITGNTRDFIRMHGKAMHHHGYAFNSATNEAIASGLVNLFDYEIASWILGAESTADETFNSLEQLKVRGFLNSGRKLFVSGSEIAWDLDNRGDPLDKEFIRQYLKSQYVADAPGNISNTYYLAAGINESIFHGISGINFDNGSHGTFNVSWPDVITGVNGGEIAMIYPGYAGQNGAAVTYKGLFPGSSSADDTPEGAVVVFGFPFETIYPEEKRFEVMHRILNFFDDVSDNSALDYALPNEIVLHQNYPNPFNPTTTIRYALADAGAIKITVYDVLGQEITTLLDGYREAGNHSVQWNAGSLASGVYVYTLRSANMILTKKMLLMK